MIREGLRFYMPFIAFFRDTNKKGGNEPYPDPVKVIRDALAHALVYYYPLAGRLKEGDSRKLMVDCTREFGVLFIEADADITLEHLGDAIQPPCPYLEHFLCDVPGSSGIIGCPLMLIQVTRSIQSSNPCSEVDTKTSNYDVHLRTIGFGRAHNLHFFQIDCRLENLFKSMLNWKVQFQSECSDGTQQLLLSLRITVLWKSTLARTT
ncbi:hypothetical protein D5086_001148 [Populus alba]|uniref:Uncharacterized protein n=1 Tax=Populus alba TaxID=43335 RepID=A0ACC4CZ54_POPAL